MAQENQRSKIGKFPPAVSFANARFDDFDALAASAKQWDADFRLLDTGGFRGELLQVLTPTALLLRCQFVGGVEQLGMVPGGCRTFGLAMPDCSPHHWRGRFLTENHVLMFPPSGELDSRSFSGFQFYPISVPEPVLTKLAAQLELDWVASGKERVVKCDQRWMSTLREHAARIIGLCASGLSLPKQHEVDRLMEELVTSLLLALDSHEEERPKPMAEARRQALVKALDVIESRPGEAWRISELCKLTGVSRRTLQYAFEEKFSASPKQYLHARRLVEVKRHLQAHAGKDVLVSEVASRFGFWHTGQFAADFRNHFGCLPSEVISQG